MPLSPPARSICVFAGSSMGCEPAFQDTAAALGRELAARGYGLVYGGANVGLMGIVANAALDAGGWVTGVIPEFLAGRELAHPGIQDLRLVTSMHERKLTMANLSDGFVALPGGFGTIEEFFEVLTWGQLGLHAKPCGLLNAAGYYDDLLRFLDTTVSGRLVTQTSRAMVLVAAAAPSLLDQFASYTAPTEGKWVELERT